MVGRKSDHADARDRAVRSRADSLSGLQPRIKGSARGKLKAVARAWASGRDGPDIPEGDPLTAAAAEHIRARYARPDHGIEIGPDEVDAVNLFYAMTTQWRWLAMSGRRSGMDYDAMPAVAAMLGLEMTPSLFLDVQLMEIEALRIMATRP